MNSNAFTRRFTGRLARALFAAGSILLAGASIAPAAAQAPDAGQAADPLKDAFDALPQAERFALQDALVWTGDYKGAIDGVLGRGGVAALNAYAKRANATPQSLLEDARRKQLIAQGQRLRAAVRFQTVRDARSGAEIGLPAAIFTRRANTQSGVRFVNAAGSASLETFRLNDGDLRDLYEGLRERTPTRRVTYAILRADFFVVSGEDQRGMFYTRAARAEANGAQEIRGYTLVYARPLQPTFGTFAIAISNAFTPFPVSAQAQQAESGQSGEGASPDAGPRRRVEATAVALSPARAVSALSRDCPDMRVADRPARIVRRDAASGLALIETQGLGAAMTNPAPRAPGETDVFVLFATQAGQSASVSLSPGKMLAPASARGQWRVSAPVQDGIGGAAVYDRSGSWAGLLAQPSQEPRRVSGVVPQAARRLIPAEDVMAFLAASGVKLEAGFITAVIKSAGEIAAANAAALNAVSCQR